MKRVSSARETERLLEMERKWGIEMAAFHAHASERSQLAYSDATAKLHDAMAGALQIAYKAQLRSGDLWERRSGTDHVHELSLVRNLEGA